MIFDLHNDFPTKLPPDKFGEYCRDAQATITAAIWTTELENARVRLAETVKALHGDANCRRMPVAVEDLGFLYEGGAYKTFDYSDFAYCSLTWNYDNGFAGGALDAGGLTDAGRELIELMNGKCAIDLAHLNEKSFYAALEHAQRPCCAHTGFNEHPRSLDDAQVRELLARRAPIGLCTVTAICGADSFSRFVAVIDGFVQKYGQDGVDCLAFGSDFNGSTDIPADVCDYAALDSVGFELIRLGYDGESVDKIKYRNAARLCGRG